MDHVALNCADPWDPNGWLIGPLPWGPMSHHGPCYKSSHNTDDLLVFWVNTTIIRLVISWSFGFTQH
jgi:hypothetical protein